MMSRILCLPGPKWITDLFNKKRAITTGPRTAGWASRRRTPQVSAPPRLEVLEDRLAPATLVVTSAADNTGPGTLRSAITTANHTPGLVTINFAIGPRGSFQTINLTSALPTITGT